MRVCSLTTSYPLYPGDYSGIFVHDLNRTLVEKGCSVTAIAPQADSAPRERYFDGVETRRFAYAAPKRFQRLFYRAGLIENLRSSPYLGLLLPPAMLSFLWTAVRSARGCDVLHAHWELAGLVALVASRLRRIPVVLSVHHALPSSTAIRHFNSAFDAVIFNSSYTASLNPVSGTRPYPIVIHPAVDIDFFSPMPRHTVSRKKFGVRDSDFLISSIGRLIELKGHSVLIRALGFLQHRLGLENARLLIAGDGPLAGRLLAEAERETINGSVAFLGAQSRDEVRDLLRVSDVLSMPSLSDSRGQTEALGMVIMEAVSSGIPVVASSVGGIPDLLAHMESGILVPPNDPIALAKSIKLLADDHDLRKSLSKRARQTAQARFSIEHHANAVLSIYERVCDVV